MKKTYGMTLGGRAATWSRRRMIFAVAILIAMVTMGGGIAAQVRANDGSPQGEDGRLITLYDRGVERSFLTSASTVGGALAEAGVEVDARDRVEPGLDEELVADKYAVNVYRARPLLIVDGNVRHVIMTAAQVPAQIAKDAELTLYPEDRVELEQSDSILIDGAAERFAVTRATAFELTLYGETFTARTQADTVGDMLEEKDVTLGENDRVSKPADTPIREGMELRVWREGKQTITVNEKIDFEVEQIQDANRKIGYKEVRTAGKAGKASVTYEVTIRDGEEVSRKKISSVVTKPPVKQVEVVGVKTSGNPLTKSMGVNQFTDSNGVVHRETYYDLPMAVVMGNCGGGGFYEVRADGAKVDRDGYVIIAAHLGNYPRCSVVETSMGLGKVYDTGGFTQVHPHGFDLATDWTRADGI